MNGARVSLLLGTLAAAAVACETVDLGPPPADVNACRPSQAFFIEQIWPNFLAKEYDGGKHCSADRDCVTNVCSRGVCSPTHCRNGVLDSTESDVDCGGIDYHSLSRHFSIGLRAGYFVLFDVSSSQDLITTAYLRYTF